VNTQQRFAARGGPSLDEAKRRYAHGSYARYTLAGCRCFACKVANADYVAELSAARRLPWRLVRGRGHIIEHRETGERVRFADRASAFAERDRRNRRAAPNAPDELVSTGKVRRHLHALRKEGVGLKSAAQAAGMSASVIRRIASGVIKRTRRSNEARLLAVDAGAVRGSTKIDGTRTWELLDALVGFGYKKGWIAQQLGATKPALQMHNRSVVTAKKAQAVEALVRRLCATDARLRHVCPNWEATPAAVQTAGAKEKPVSLYRRDADFRRRMDAVFADLADAL
jgi:hypothetical protein